MTDAPAVTLYLVRHGLGVGMAGQCIGHTDAPLAAAGRAPLEQLANVWPAPHPLRVHASDLARASDSASVLTQAWHDGAARVVTDARLREMDFGAWDGRTWDEIGQTDADALSAWMADWHNAPAPAGEAFGDVVARTGAWLADVVGAARAAGDTQLVVVAHAGSIRALLVHAVGLPRAMAFRLRIDHGRVSALRIAGAVEAGSCDAGEVLFVNADRIPAGG